MTLFPELVPVPVSETQFAAFYLAYPRKRAKADALKAWKAARKLYPADVILTAVARLVAEGREPEFWPYPATFLRRHLEDYVHGAPITVEPERLGPVCPDHGAGACRHFAGSGWIHA